MSTGKKIAFIAGVFVVAFLAVIIYVYSNLSDITKGIVEKQVPRLTFADLDVGWNNVELSGVEYRSTDDKAVLKAEKLVVKPSFTSFFSDTFSVASVQIEKPYVFLRIRRDGEVELPVPDLADETAPSDKQLAEAQTTEPAKAFAIDIGSFKILDGSGEIVDESVGRPYAKFKIKQVNVVLENIHHPKRSDKMPLAISFVIEGQRQGRIEVSGWYNSVSKSGEIEIDIENVFIPQAEPYYRSPDTTAKLKDGSVGLKAKIDLDEGKFKVPGEISMGNIQFESDQGKFFKVPVSSVKSFFDKRKEPITVPFEVAGDLDSDENYRVEILRVIAKRMAETIGVEVGREKLRGVEEKLRAGDKEGAKEEVNKLKEELKGLKGLFKR